MPATRTSKFFDRDIVIAKIEDHFLRDDLGAFRSLTLYGMAGIGKTHVAMKYAEKKYSAGDLDAVLWAESENSMTMKQSFTNMAKQLRLSGATPTAHDDNRLAVLTWLQHTRMSPYLNYCAAMQIICLE